MRQDIIQHGGSNVARNLGEFLLRYAQVTIGPVPRPGGAQCLGNLFGEEPTALDASPRGSGRDAGRQTHLESDGSLAGLPRLRPGLGLDAQPLPRGGTGYP